MRKPAPLPVPGPVWGPYPENRHPWSEKAHLERWLQELAAPLGQRRSEAGFRAFVARVRLLEAPLGLLDEPSLAERIRQLRPRLRNSTLPEDLLAEAFACLGEYSQRHLGRRPFDVQLIGARIVLTGGLAEMATGEGKTLTIGLAAACGALAGMPVHVMTVNDYLVRRDAEILVPLYAALGLSIACITEAATLPERRVAYAADIVYVTAKELVFDSLRDVVEPGAEGLRWHTDSLLGNARPTTLRGLCLGILDEADSILIDEARVPLILSDATVNPETTTFFKEALALARGLKEGDDFALDAQAQQAMLTPRGKQRVKKSAGWLSRPWLNRTHREAMVALALVAQHALHRDRDYLVADDAVHIIDPNTGRTAPGRAWSQGLHQLVEMKEACAPTSPAYTLVATSFQHFFPRYVRLGGLSGTLHEARRELFATYGLAVCRVPLHRPSRRITLAPRLFADHASLWPAVCTRVREILEAGRPVLIGTESVFDSEALSGQLLAAGIAHALLNARNDSEEAAIIAHAGEAGRVTVATNMAGRGTDILLAPEVAERGGLHVINCQLNDARRIDRQLVGRCARQGDPGSVETWLSLENRLLRDRLSAGLRRWLARYCPMIPSRLLTRLFNWPQRQREKHDCLLRRRLREQTKRQNRQLAFSATRE
jgi:preprotein translocase subunit SecA